MKKRRVQPLLVSIFILTALWSCAEDSKIFELTASRTPGEISFGETHRYALEVPADQQVKARLDPRGSAWVVTAKDPEGAVIGKFEISDPSAGPQDLVFVTTLDGRHLVEIAALEPEGTGKYGIRLVEKLDKDKAQAQEAADREVVEAAAAWLRERAHPLQTVLAEQGFDDLQPLREMVGAARVVAVGEATHGSREFFQLKHRMLEFLVEEMGFTVFAIEATMPESFDVDEYVLHGTGNAAEALKGLGFWTWNTEEVLEMIEWMCRYNADPSHRQKVRFYGFDMQSPFRAAKVSLSYLAEVDPDAAKIYQEALGSLTDPFLEGTLRRAPISERETRAEMAKKLVVLFDSHHDEYISRSDSRGWAWARQHARILAQTTAMELDRQGEVRDQAMAENVLWILEQEGPDAKIMLWAHNAHVHDGPIFGSIPAMGTHLRRELGDQMIVLGLAFQQGAFQSYGDAGKLESFRLPPAKGSLGEMLGSVGHPIFAVDLRPIPQTGVAAEWFSKARPIRSIGSYYNPAVQPTFLSYGKAHELYDGILFVDTTARARPLESNVPEPPETLDVPSNGDFEAGSEHPENWYFSGEFGYRFSFRQDESGMDRHGVIRRPPGKYYGEKTGSLTQSIQATPYRGRTVHLKASLRLAEGSRAYIWISESGPRRKKAPRLSEIHRVKEGGWQEVHLSGPVGESAEFLNYGVTLSGNGEVEVDDVILEFESR